MRSLVIEDNFLRDPERMRELALGQRFGTVTFDGHDYDGIATSLRLSAFPDVRQGLSAALGFPVKPAIDFWRIGTAGDRVTSWIHADSAAASHAALLYLCDPPKGEWGTAFWRHNRSCQEWLTGSSDAERLHDDANDESKWTRTDFVSCRFNRLIVYPTVRFHSRFPMHCWGEGPESGRLTWVCFVNPD